MFDPLEGVKVLLVQSPYHFSKARSEVRGGPPFRGEHNTEALYDWLDLATDQINVLVQNGVLLDEERP